MDAHRRAIQDQQAALGKSYDEMVRASLTEVPDLTAVRSAYMAGQIDATELELFVGAALAGERVALPEWLRRTREGN